MALKKKHKVMIGGFSLIVLLFMIAMSVFMYVIYIKQDLNYKLLDKKISELELDLNSKINKLTTSLIQTREELDTNLVSLNEEFDLLKASAGKDFSGIIEDVIKSVVTIKTDVSQGTGFIITDSGYAITNAHVLTGGRELISISYDQKILDTDFIGYDETYDIALLKVQEGYDYLELADSDEIQIGEKVIAIGNPLGLQFSVSEGIISAINRAGINGVNAYIQTDAALNPGNSGGPLINTQGKVVGINNFKIGGGENLGFALESNYIEEVVNKIAFENLNQTLI